MTCQLTRKQIRFVEEYLVDLNATQAAIRAGYSTKTARSQGQRLLTNVDIARRIGECMDERNKRVKMDADRVLQRLVEIDQMDVLDIMPPEGGLKPVSEWPPIWRECVTSMDLAEIWEGTGDERKVVGVLKKIRWPDKLKNLEMIGRHVSVQAWKDRVEGGLEGKTIGDLLEAVRQKG